MKEILQLPKEIYNVLLSEEDNSHGDIIDATSFAERLVNHYNRATNFEKKERKEKVLYASEIGKPCARQTYYSMTVPEVAEPLTGPTRYKFLYGDIIEELTLELAKAAGYEVSNEQAVFQRDFPNGWKVRGRIDADINGHRIDVKSASRFALQKYQKLGGVTAESDSFGYREQLYFYSRDMEAYSEDSSVPIISAKTPYFLFVGKEMGNIDVLRPVIHDVEYEETIADKVAILDVAFQYDTPPDRYAGGIKHETNGNETLKAACSYCSFKKHCYPDLKAYLYSTGPKFFTKVVKEPKVMELDIRG